VKSEPGTGSTFSFSLPIPGQHVPFARPTESRPLELSQPETPSPILIVDPDSDMVDLVRRQIDEFEVIQVQELAAVGDEILLHHPSAVVVNVPPGEEANIEGVCPASVPIIECSLPSRAWTVHDFAVQAYLGKPLTSDRLLQEIERVGKARDILVVDDDRGFCQLVMRILEASGEGFRVRQAYSGEKGLQSMRVQPPDLLLLDLIMPNMDGFQVLERMRQEPELAGVPVILLTVTTFVEDTIAKHGSRMSIYRLEGLHPAEVLGCLRAVLGVLEPRYDERPAAKQVLLGR